MVSEGKAMADSQEPQDSEAQVSGAQIAVHWRGGENYPPPPGVRRAGQREERFPDGLKEYADLLSWDEPGVRHWTPATRHSGSGSPAAG
jgi:hypothetical protein